MKEAAFNVWRSAKKKPAKKVAEQKKKNNVPVRQEVKLAGMPGEKEEMKIMSAYVTYQKIPCSSAYKRYFSASL